MGPAPSAAAQRMHRRGRLGGLIHEYEPAAAREDRILTTPRPAALALWPWPPVFV
jgi:hypothetical protein